MTGSTIEQTPGRSAPRPGGVVGVVTGGTSRERDRSLLSGEAVTASLRRQEYTVRVLDPADPEFVSEVSTVDSAFLAIAGQGAEDGKLQGALELCGVPYTGSGVLASALAMHKRSAKAVLRPVGVPLLEDAAIPPDASADDAAARLVAYPGLPLIVKPMSEGGSIDIQIARSESELTMVVQELGARGQRLFAERFCPGRSITIGVLESGDDLIALPALETRTAGEFYDYHAKRDPRLHSYVCPAQLPTGIADRISALARAAHRGLGCSGYSRSDFVIGADRDMWWLELNTLPGLSTSGNLATMAAAAGIDYDDLVRRILATARTPAGYRP